MANTNAKTKRIHAAIILKSARRVKDAWEVSGEFFAGYKLAKPDFETLLTEGAAVDNTYAGIVATEKVVHDRLDSEYKADIIAAKEKRAAKIAALVEEKRLVEAERAQKLTALSRATQGAKLFAQSNAFSDDNLENDAAAQEL